MIAPETAQRVLADDAIYIGDAGHAFCGRHAGHCAKHTGHDISGQPVIRLTAALLTPGWRASARWTFA